MRLASGALIEVLGAVAVCGASAGAGCPAGVAAVTFLAGKATEAIPDTKEIFYVGVPSTEKWLDTWGAAFEPVVGEGGDIPPFDTTGCHLWTDDFDGWCAREVGGGWGVKARFQSDCPTGQGRARCAEGYKAGIELKPGEDVTHCHLWTDNFDGWCEKEFGPGYGMRTRAQHGCLTGQGKAVCARGFWNGRRLAAKETTGCHLWTDDFDGWCRAEFGGRYRIEQGSNRQGACIWGQGQATCALQ